MAHQWATVGNNRILLSHFNIILGSASSKPDCCSVLFAHQVKPCIEEYYKVYFELAYTVDYLAEKQKIGCNQVQAGCKESQF